MAISASSLFHFTKGGIEVLKKILVEGFKVSYCEEIHPSHFTNNDNHNLEVQMPFGINSNTMFSTKILIPMVCFCDIPLSQIKNHVSPPDGYGYYGIGLSKKWGISKGLNPVFYIANNSQVAREISQYRYQKTSAITSKSREYFGSKIETYDYDDSISDIIDNYGNIYPTTMLFYKAVGEKVFKGFKDSYIELRETKSYQDEKEWRYLPSRPYIINIRSRHGQTNPYHWQLIEAENKIRRENKPTYENLIFCWEDITFIIVKNDIEVDEMTEFVISKIDYKNGKEEEKLALSIVSKIISYEKLQRDIMTL